MDEEFQEPVNAPLLSALFPGDFKRENGPLRHSGKRPIKIGKRPIKEGKQMGSFRAPSHGG